MDPLVEAGSPPPPPAPPPAVPAPAQTTPTGLQPATYRDIIAAEAKKQRVPPQLALAMVDQESSGDPSQTSAKGAHGFFQLMPETAKELGVDPTDPIQNIRGGLKYFRQQLDAHGGDVSLALASYNAGPGAVKTHGGIPPFPETQDYVKRILGKLSAAPAEGAQPVASSPKPTPSAQPAGAAPQPTVGTPPTAPPETWTQWGVRHGKAILSGFDPRTPEGRRNIAGGVGGVAGAILGAPTAVVSGPAGPAFSGAIGAMAAGGLEAGGEALIRHVTGASELGGDPGKPPPTMPQVIGAAGAGATEQGLYEMGGHVLMWPAKAVGRRVIAGPVARNAVEGLNKAKTATLATLSDALDASQSLLRTTRAKATEATAQAASGTRTLVSDAAGAARKGVQEAQAKGTSHQEVAATTGRQRVQDAVATGASEKDAAQTAAAEGVSAAEDRAAKGEAAARAPYDELVGTPPPSAEAAGQQVNTQIQTGGAAKARDIAGQAVDASADTGPDVDITKLKAEAQKVIESQIKPPAESFPRSAPGADTAALDDQIAEQGGLSLDHLKEMRARAAGEPGTTGMATSPRAQQAAQENLKNLTAAVSAAQSDAGQESLKHPAMGILSRIMNAGDTVPFKDAHLWKVELDNAIRGTRDQSVRSQVASLTQKFTGSLRGALKEAGHAPYEAATAAYAKIAPLYTKGVAPRLRKLAVEEPEAIVRLLNPAQPTRATMLVNLLTHQAEAGGDAEGGRQALESVQAAWVHQKLVVGGIEKLGDRLAKLPPAFRDAFLGDAKAKAVLDNLQLIHTAFKTAQLTGEAGVEAATSAGKAGIEAAGESAATRTAGAKEATRKGTEAIGDLAAQRTTAARESGFQAVTDARATRANTVGGVRQAGAADVESAAQQVEPAKRALQEGRTATKAAQTSFNKSSLAPFTSRGSTRQAATDALRAATLGPGRLYGAISIGRLLTGPTAQDLLTWAAASPTGTRALVKAITSTTWDTALADLVRTSGILGPTTNEATGQTPPPPRTQAGVGSPPPR